MAWDCCGGAFTGSKASAAYAPCPSAASTNPAMNSPRMTAPTRSDVPRRRRVSSHSAAAVSMKTMGRVPAGSQKLRDQNCACMRAETTDAGPRSLL